MINPPPVVHDLTRTEVVNVSLVFAILKTKEFILHLLDCCRLKSITPFTSYMLYVSRIFRRHIDIIVHHYNYLCFPSRATQIL